LRLIELTMPLPCTVLEPRLEHAPLGAVDHDRDARDLGLGGDELRKRRHRRLRVEHALVHVDVEHVRAAAHLIERDLEGRGVVARLTSSAKRFEPVTLVRSPIIRKFVSGRIVKRLEPEKRAAGRRCRRSG
jgi:hypothetical protein